MKLVIPDEVTLAEARRKVTAGLNSLSPEYRGRRDRSTLQREYQNALVADAQQKADAAVAPDGEHTTTLLEAQIGKPMFSNDIIRRLRTLNPNLVFRRSKAFPQVMGIYYPFPGANHDDPDPEYRGLRHLFGFEAGYSPEFSVRHAKADGTFDKETRGWRTVLARLIRNRYVTKEGCDREFGLPTRASKNWHQSTT